MHRTFRHLHIDGFPSRISFPEGASGNETSTIGLRLFRKSVVDNKTRRREGGLEVKAWAPV